MAGKTVTEITCDATRYEFSFPEAGMIIDIGGQDSKVIAVTVAAAGYLTLR